MKCSSVIVFIGFTYNCLPSKQSILIDLFIYLLLIQLICFVLKLNNRKFNQNKFLVYLIKGIKKYLLYQGVTQTYWFDACKFIYATCIWIGRIIYVNMFCNMRNMDACKLRQNLKYILILIYIIIIKRLEYENFMLSGINSPNKYLSSPGTHNRWFPQIPCTSRTNIHLDFDLNGFGNKLAWKMRMLGKWDIFLAKIGRKNENKLNRNRHINR